MNVTIRLTLTEYSWLQEAVHQMLDDIPHTYDSDASEDMLRVGRGIDAQLRKVEQEQVYTH
jgi:hypothetical protein